MVQLASQSTLRSSSRKIASSSALVLLFSLIGITAPTTSISRRQQHLSAGRRQIGHFRTGPRLRRRRVGLGVELRGGEPMVELLAAALVRGPRRLRLAFLVVGGAIEPDVEVIVVAPPRLHLVEPVAVAAGFAAQRLLDGRIDEDSGDLRVL